MSFPRDGDEPLALRLTDRKRKDILAACVAEFRDHGFAAARIDRIAERAQVSKRTLYRHFRSKEEMFDVIAAQATMPLPAEKKVDLKPGISLADQLEPLLVEYMSVISGDEYVTISRILVAEFIADPQRSHSASKQEEAAVGPIEHLLSQAMKEGLIRKLPMDYALTQLMGMLKSFVFWPRFLEGRKRLGDKEREKIIRDCLQMFLSHYKLPDASSPR